jgi:methylmalonyl-CoA epimerase
MIIRILEIGVAVRNFAQSAQRLAFILGGRTGKPLAAAEYDMTAQMVRVGNIEFELMEPMGEEGLIENFIRQRGQGLHHIAFQVDDIVQTISDMEALGVKVINEEPLLAHGVKAVFLHPESFGGVLFELIEGTPRWVDDRPLPADLQTPDPTRGVGAEGILAVGIIVEDVEAAAKHYSKAFSAKASKTLIAGHQQSKACICRIGNIDLVLLRMPTRGAPTNSFFDARRPGLHHVVIGVEDIWRSAEFLKIHVVPDTCR